jgi:hypothetical protein
MAQTLLQSPFPLTPVGKATAPSSSSTGRQTGALTAEGLPIRPRATNFRGTFTREHPPMTTDEQTVYHYRDFPELFQDLDPDAEVDQDDPLIITRVLREGNLAHVKKLVRMNVLAREIGQLELPANIRDFWSLVLRKIAERQPLELHA